jgi:acyl CoA:acetate/3-ketoacid CoA transferase beta subunit
MIRGQHVDLTILGMEVSENGDKLEDSRKNGKGMGGAWI